MNNIETDSKDTGVQSGQMGKVKIIVAHYYGDPLRRIFVAIAVISVLVIPLWGNLLPFGTFFELLSALLLVLLAGLTNPHSPTVAVINTLVSATGALLLEMAAIDFYHSQSFLLFAIRETTAILFLFSLYFAVKTLRAMLLKQVGHLPEQGEFNDLKK